MHDCKTIAVLGLLGSVFAVATAADPPAVPEDFKIVARFSPGFSTWRPWHFTITADGKVLQDIEPGRSGGERTEKETKLSKDDIGALFTKVKDADFFKLEKEYKAQVTDQPTLVLEVTMDKKTHQVLVYGQRLLKEKADQEGADRFLSVWSEVLRKVPAPNEDQKADLYKPGNYGKR